MLSAAVLLQYLRRDSEANVGAAGRNSLKCLSVFKSYFWQRGWKRLVRPIADVLVPVALHFLHTVSRRLSHHGQLECPH